MPERSEDKEMAEGERSEGGGEYAREGDVYVVYEEDDGDVGCDGRLTSVKRNVWTCTSECEKEIVKKRGGKYCLHICLTVFYFFICALPVSFNFYFVILKVVTI